MKKTLLMMIVVLLSINGFSQKHNKKHKQVQKLYSRSDYCDNGFKAARLLHVSKNVRVVIGKDSSICLVVNKKTFNGTVHSFTDIDKRFSFSVFLALDKIVKNYYKDDIICDEEIVYNESYKGYVDCDSDLKSDGINQLLIFFDNVALERPACFISVTQTKYLNGKIDSNKTVLVEIEFDDLMTLRNDISTWYLNNM